MPKELLGRISNIVIEIVSVKKNDAFKGKFKENRATNTIIYKEFIIDHNCWNATDLDKSTIKFTSISL